MIQNINIKYKIYTKMNHANKQLPFPNLFPFVLCNAFSFTENDKVDCQ